MRKGKRLKIALLLLCLPLLAGCWNMMEIEHMYYVFGMGVDYNDNKFDIYVQILNFDHLSKRGESGSKGSDSPMWVGHGTGVSLDEAFHNLYPSTQRKLYFGHLNSIVVTERLLKRGMDEEVLGLNTRFNETRLTPWVFATSSPLKELLTAPPILEKSPVFSQLGDPKDMYEQSSNIKPIRIHRLMAEMREPGKTAFLPSISIKKNDWYDQDKNYTALHIDGVYTMKGERFSTEDMTGWRWILSKAHRIPVHLQTGKGSVADIILESPHTEVKPAIEKGKPYFDLQVKVKGSILQLRQQLSEAELKKEAEAMIERQIRETFRTGWEHRVDLLSLSQSLYRKDSRQWHELTASDPFFLKEDSLRNIEVHVQLLSSGMMQMTPFRDTRTVPLEKKTSSESVD